MPSPTARIGYDPLLIAEEGLARYTEAGLTMVPVSPQPGGRGVDRSPAAAHGARRAAPAGVCGAIGRREAGGDRQGADRGQAGRRCADRPRLDRLVAQYPRQGRAVHAVRAGVRPGARRRRHRAVHGSGQAARRDPRLAGQCGVGGWARRAGSRFGAVGRQAGAGRSGRLAGVVRADAARRPARRWWPGRTPACCRRRARTRWSSGGPANAHARDAVAVCRFLHWLDDDGARRRR